MCRLGVNLSRVVVTGGAGFIGSNLAEELVARGDDVVIIDNLATGRLRNIQGMLASGMVEFVEGSVTDLSLLQRLFRGIRYVYHQAALGSVPRSIDNPLASHDSNVTGTLNVLIASRDNEVEKVVFASSSSVYGDSPHLPRVESLELMPMSPYAVTKLAGEHYCRIFQQIYNLPSACLRYFNVFGPRQNPFSQYAAVIPNFIRKIKEGGAPVIYGDGEQTRDFTFVQDAVRANILAAESDCTGPLNVSGGNVVSIRKLAGLIGELLDSVQAPVQEPPRAADARHSWADISLARAFGYDPTYDMKQGLEETIRSFEQDEEA